jgi:hypothetical protein
LPSEVAEKATIFDMVALDIKSSWDEYHRATPDQRAKILSKNIKVEDYEKIKANLKS